MDKGIKLSLLLSAVFAAIGIVFGGFIYGYSERTALVYGLMGAFLGAVGAPEIEPKYFKYPTAWQIVFSILGCLLFAVGIESSPMGYLVAAITGGFLGYTAHYWIKHVVFP